jgi:hypothetical protein
MDEDQLGESLLDELEGRQPKNYETGLQQIPGVEEPGIREMGILDYIEEYAMFVVLACVVLYFVYKSMSKRVSEYKYSSAARQAEDSMRRARMLQQAKFELESAQRREELARIEEERRQQKLEEMEAMQEGRSAKKPEKKKGPETRDFWDRTDGFNPLGGGGGSKSYKPTTRRRG